MPARPFPTMLARTRRSGYSGVLRSPRADWTGVTRQTRRLWEPAPSVWSWPRLYVAGTAVAGTQRQCRLFIENCHAHVEKTVAALTGQPHRPTTTMKDREYEV